MNFIDRLLHDQYEALALYKYGLPQHWATVLLTPHYVTSRHIVALIYARRERDPCLVVKVPRQPADNGGVQREAHALSQLAALSGDYPPGVPQVIGTPKVGAYTVLIETALSGAALDPPRVAANLSAAIDAGFRFVATLPVTRAAIANGD